MKTRGRQRGKSRRRPGFTLMEVLIAMSIIVISVIALISLISAGMTMDRVSNHNSEATVIAKGYMEQMLDYSSFNGADTAYNDAATTRRQVSYNGDTTTYKVNLSVQSLSTTLNQYNVTVYWQRDDGSTTSLTFITEKWDSE